MDILFDLHKKRWDSIKNKYSTFDNKYRIKFNKTLLKLNEGKNNIIFSKLLVKDQVESILYIFHHKKNFYFYQNGWNPDFSKYSIGLVHLILFVQYAISKKAKTFDLLRGDEPYKFKLSNDIRNTYTIYITSYFSKASVIIFILAIKKTMVEIFFQNQIK